MRRVSIREGREKGWRSGKRCSPRFPPVSLRAVARRLASAFSVCHGKVRGGVLRVFVVRGRECVIIYCEPDCACVHLKFLRFVRRVRRTRLDIERAVNLDAFGHAHLAARTALDQLLREMGQDARACFRTVHKREKSVHSALVTEASASRLLS